MRDTLYNFLEFTVDKGIEKNPNIITCKIFAASSDNLHSNIKFRKLINNIKHH